MMSNIPKIYLYRWNDARSTRAQERRDAVISKVSIFLAGGIIGAIIGFTIGAVR